VATTTKPDIIRATALHRAQYGKVWCYAPDGQTPIPPGVQELRWSPLAGAEDWAVAIRTAHDITKTMSTTEVTHGDHWRDRARDVLSPVFHWAAVRGLPLRAARDAVLELATVNADPENPRRKLMLGDLIARELQRMPAANPAASSVLTSVMSTGERELASIVSTAARALQVYQLPQAITSTEQPNFDPAAFVRGEYGRSTVYIMSSNESQQLVAPLVVAFLGQIRQAQFRQQRLFAHAQMSQRDGSDPGDDNEAALAAALRQDIASRVSEISTTVFALDEMYGIAPIPDLANMLSEGGSQGVLVAGAVQDLALIKDRWRIAGDSFMTLFQDVLVYPGLRHGDTLEAVSKVIGDYDRETPGTSYGQGGQGPTWNVATSLQRRRIMPPDEVSRGPVAGNQDVIVHLSPQGAGQLVATPYWRAAPWPQVLTNSIEMALRCPESTWAQYRRMTGRPVDEPPLTDLPIPNLARWAEQSRAFDPWAERYLAARRQWEGRLLPCTTPTARQDSRRSRRCAAPRRRSCRRRSRSGGRATHRSRSARSIARPSISRSGCSRSWLRCMAARWPSCSATAGSCCSPAR
jgi:type IV secretory pathway TraG/TraD family ATPase VirD4